MRDRLGIAFFTFAAVVSGLFAWEHPTVLAWLVSGHNAVLALIYSHRKPAQEYDRFGLALGLLAALLPLVTPFQKNIPLPFTILGCCGYALIFWSLVTLGNRFGIAPADRGLVVRGPYRLVRHPMYLGELVLRVSLVAASPQLWIALVTLLALGGIQIVRALREETIIAGYKAYSNQVRYRLVPGVW
jgi:protein-S-isoprenylcysteine O-methyltransferase Ste14